MKRSDSIRLQKMRSRLITLYSSARKAHRGQATASRKVFDVTTALLKAEVRAYHKRIKSPETDHKQHSMADLFAMEARHG